MGGRRKKILKILRVHQKAKSYGRFGLSEKDVKHGT